MLCHLLLISIVLIIYALLTCVPSMFHLIPFGMSIIYSYHLRIPVMSLSIHILSIFLSCFIYSFMYDNHMFTSYNLIFICAYHSCTLDYHILWHILSYLIISYDLYLSYLMTYPYTFLYLYILLVLYQTVLSPVGVKNRDSSVDTHRYFLTYTLLHINSTYILFLFHIYMLFYHVF